MKRQHVVLLGYLAAVIGVITYLVTKKTGGVMAGGTLLVLTSLYNVIADRKNKK